MGKVAVILVIAVISTLSLAALGNIRGLNAQQTASPGLEAKLDTVISNQETMLQKLDDMAEQIHIVKIRATR